MVWQRILSDGVGLALLFSQPHQRSQNERPGQLQRTQPLFHELAELGRLADIRQTAKYTHIGMKDRARALGNLVTPDTSESVKLSEMCRVSGGVLGQEVSACGREGGREGESKNKKTPSEEGVSSSAGIASQELAFDASYGGGGNCTRVPRSIGAGLYVRIRFFDCRPRSPNRKGLPWLIPL